jgi:isopenicillin-N N-acyltransferase-like protein
MWRLRYAVPIALLTFLVAPPARAQQPFRYPEAKHGPAELRYVNGVPVLTVAGTPEEIGGQIGKLALKPAEDIPDHIKAFLRTYGLERAYPFIIRTGNLMVPQFPPHHVKEMEAAAKASGLERDLLIFTATVFDMWQVGGCSTLLVEPGRSATGGVLMGRNLDWAPFGRAQEYSLVTVFRPRGKKAFATIGFPGMHGCMSGMNEDGLCIAFLEVVAGGDDSPRFTPDGTPLLLLFRRVLEECATLEEAETLFKSTKRTTRANLSVCDKKHGGTFELTPKNVVLRRGEEGVCACTNHFRSALLAGNTDCRRFEALEKSRKHAKLDRSEVQKHLHAANQGPATMQTMIFEPGELKLHLAFGTGPSSALPLKTIPLGSLFRGKANEKE